MTTNPFNIDEHIKRLTAEALASVNNNRTKAAALLGVSIKTLRNWVNRFGLEKPFPDRNKEKKKRLGR